MSYKKYSELIATLTAYVYEGDGKIHEDFGFYDVEKISNDTKFILINDAYEKAENKKPKYGFRVVKPEERDVDHISD